jgi:phosphomannomutase
MTPAEASAAAERWIEADPDPQTRSALAALVAAGAHSELVELMSGTLGFGTAGLRALVGPGPARMNRAVVRRTTAGVARYLLRRADGRTPALVVVGADARPSSAEFLREAVGVLAAYGVPVRFFAEPVATPIVAFAAQQLRAAAAIVITASHNPPAYNGYKLYGADAVQIAAGDEAAVAAEIARSAAASAEPCLLDASAGGSPLAAPLEATLITQYVAEVVQLAGAPEEQKSLRVAYTPLHGVGYAPVRAAFAGAGFGDILVVPEQREPDGTFPTLRFPNPEEPGTLERLLAFAQQEQAELALANDPDADRLAAAVPDGHGGWQTLTGNQIGVLLADYLLARAPRSPQPLCVQSVVSSPMLASICDAHGARLERTLTGFKWIWTAALALCHEGNASFVFAYEEALGYSVGSLVRDKDGISAGLALAVLSAEEKARGRGLRQRLENLFLQHGLWVSAQHNITREGNAGSEAIARAMSQLAKSPPERIGTSRVSRVVDYRTGGSERPAWLGESNLLELELGAEGRLLVRPSGTEPKLKIYVDLAAPPPAPEEIWPTYQRTLERAQDLARTLAADLGLEQTAFDGLNRQGAK